MQYTYYIVYYINAYFFFFCCDNGRRIRHPKAAADTARSHRLICRDNANARPRRTMAQAKITGYGRSRSRRVCSLSFCLQKHYRHYKSLQYSVFYITSFFYDVYYYSFYVIPLQAYIYIYITYIRTISINIPTLYYSAHRLYARIVRNVLLTKYRDPCT